MHELSLAEDIIRIIQDAAVAQHFNRVRAVWLEVGCMSAVEPDALHFCFDAVARDTIAQDARLEIVMVPGSGTCADCGSVHPMTDRLDACPACGSYAVRVTGGTELRVNELDVVDELTGADLRPAQTLRYKR